MKRTIEVLPLAELESQPINARFMKGEQFRTLVKNIERDGVLTSVPLVRTLPGGGWRILSGHHRVKAAIEAGIERAECMILDDPNMNRQQEVALVLSHNAIAGEDDPSLLKALYDELDDTDWRWYSGLDDRALDLLDKVSTESLSEANLDFSTVNLVFLPHELEAAEEALFEAKKRAGVAKMWLAGLEQYEPTLEALETAQGAYGVGNTATALGVILGVFDRHLTDLAEGWVDENDEPTAKKPVPIETAFGTRMVPPQDAAMIRKALKAAQEAGDLSKTGGPWEFISMLAATYMMSVDVDKSLRGDEPAEGTDS